MYYLAGGRAVSEYQRIKTKIALDTLTAYYLYFIDTSRPLSASEAVQVHTLLPQSQAIPVDNVEQLPVSGPDYLLVVPRLGTVSPWSSKATEIAKICGFSMIKRLERGVLWCLASLTPPEQVEQLKALIHDRMTEVVLTQIEEAQGLFATTPARPLGMIPLLSQGRAALVTANQAQGLALSASEIDYLLAHFTQIQRDPTDVELMMFAQANSEHCRHKIFKAQWIINEQLQPYSLWQRIRQTYERHPGAILSAYHDNAAVIEGFSVPRFMADPQSHHYGYQTETTAILMKVETHNHPTAISPFPGAATGSGGEIRDEGATGQGAKPKAGLTGFSVSHLRLPEAPQPWESAYETPKRLATALEIMLAGPIGASRFNNEFGRPNICGYFRSFEYTLNAHHRGYHKPIMLAGGLGNIRPNHIQKQKIKPNTALVVLGGPALLIGLGGGAASSIAAGLSDAELDFASVQRENPEMQRRCQEVIDACWQLGADNPILSIHDVGAGGLSNALPELVHDSGCGGRFDLAAIPTADPSLSPLELWCNEAQERYVLAIAQEHLEVFKTLCQRERCPYALVGEATAAPQLQLYQDDRALIDIPLAVLFGHPPQMQRHIKRADSAKSALSLEFADIALEEAIVRILRFPTVANKSFLITIGDRSVGGLVVRDQMIGPWQIPVADCGITATSYGSLSGEAMAIGERTPVALLDAPASGRLAIGEALTNIAAAAIDNLSDIVFSANWMAACGQGEEDAALLDTVTAVTELCLALGIAIPVGKDSLSMHTAWADKAVTAPLSLIVSAFARVSDISRHLTPQLQGGDSVLCLIDLGYGKNRLGGSSLAQAYNRLGSKPPDVDDPQDLIDFFNALQSLNRQGKVLAYHDRSDGGLWVSLCEMAFASHCGLDIHLDTLGNAPLASLCAEELGAVIEVKKIDFPYVQTHFSNLNVHILGTVNASDCINLYHRQQRLFSSPRSALLQVWSETSYQMQRLRDNPHCAQQAFDALLDNTDPGLTVHFEQPLADEELFTFKAPAYLNTQPKLAILREQGVNGHLEMAAAFTHSDFLCIDVHMSDILAGRVHLQDIQGIVACGGFSYGDVLGAGTGWAQSILFNSKAYDEFAAFFQRADTFALGVCNGCQMMAQLRSLIPGADHWPTFITNESEQFEARLVMVEVLNSPSLFFRDLAGARLPIIIAHGEGRAHFHQAHAPQEVLDQALVTLRYVNNHGQMTQSYPANPNGSPLGITGLTTADGRFNIMMPHPERLFWRHQYSWLPTDWPYAAGPWMALFKNARRWLHSVVTTLKIND